MDDASFGIVAILVISILISGITHYFVKKYLRALIIATLLAAIAIQIAHWIHNGSLDQFFNLAFFTNGLYALGISATIGFPFFLYRRKFNNNKKDKGINKPTEKSEQKYEGQLNFKDVLICLDKGNDGRFTGIRIYSIDKNEVLNFLRGSYAKGLVVFGSILDSTTYDDNNITVHGNQIYARDSNSIKTKGMSGKELFKKYCKNSFVPHPRVRYSIFKKEIVRDWKILDDVIWTFSNRDDTILVSKLGVSVTEHNK